MNRFGYVSGPFGMDRYFFDCFATTSTYFCRVFVNACKPNLVVTVVGESRGRVCKSMAKHCAREIYCITDREAGA